MLLTHLFTRQCWSFTNVVRRCRRALQQTQQRPYNTQQANKKAILLRIKQTVNKQYKYCTYCKYRTFFLICDTGLFQFFLNFNTHINFSDEYMPMPNLYNPDITDKKWQLFTSWLFSAETPRSVRLRELMSPDHEVSNKPVHNIHSNVVATCTLQSPKTIHFCLSFSSHIYNWFGLPSRLM